MEVAVSITSGDLARLAEMAVLAERGGADRIHLDVEDGLFIPTFTVGPAVVSGIRRAIRLPLEVHVQTADPARWIPAVAAARADRVIVHAEADPDLRRLLGQIRNLGTAAGVALLLATPVEVVLPLLDLVDQATLLSAGPAPGSPFERVVLDKMDALRGRVQGLEVDGGIVPAVVPNLTRSGATAIVVGRAVFGRGPDEVAAGIAALRTAMAG